MHLKPYSMQDFPPTLQKRKKKCIIMLLSQPPPPAPFPSSQSFDCTTPAEALNVVFKYNGFKQAPTQLNWQSVRGVSRARVNHYDT